MTDENIKDQFVTVSNLARLLAKDRSFVSEIGLDEFPPDQVVQGLEMLFGFILAMYNTAKSIFSTYKTLTLDEKFVRLIYSRFVLYPSFSQCPLTPDLRDALDPDALNYAEECYEEIKRNADQSECKWDDMPLYTKFFEICVRVLIEEDIVDARKLADENESQSIDFFRPVDSLFGSRPVLAVAFKCVFSHVDWELNDKVESTQISQVQTRPPASLPFSRYENRRIKNTEDRWIKKKEIKTVELTWRRAAKVSWSLYWRTMVFTQLALLVGFPFLLPALVFKKLPEQVVHVLMVLGLVSYLVAGIFLYIAVVTIVLRKKYSDFRISLAKKDGRTMKDQIEIETVELTFARAVKVSWSLFWRTIVFPYLASLVGVFIMLLPVVIFKDLPVEIVYVLTCFGLFSAIVAGIFVYIAGVKMVLRKKYSGFRIALAKRDDEALY